jgi:hypothetical protein
LETWINDCVCTVWFPFGAAEVETIISQSEDTVSFSAKFMNAVSSPSPQMILSGWTSLTAVEPVMKLEIRVSFPVPPSIVSIPEPP